MTDADRPALLHTVLDAEDVRGLAEFYRELLGLVYRPGDEPPLAEVRDGGAVDDVAEDEADWLVLTEADGTRRLAFQRVPRLRRSTWPDDDVPQQLHLDLTVPDRDALERQHARALALGARLRVDSTDDVDEPLYVYVDPAGHPFCIFVG